MSVSHSAFGLHFLSNRPVPGLITVSTESAADVQMWLGTMPPQLGGPLQTAGRIWYSSPFRDEHGRPALEVWRLAGGGYFRLRYRDGTEFIVDRSGTQVWAAWPDPSTLEDAATYLLGPVLAFLLRLRGVICLHASAVAINGRAIALLGPPGAGKSTTAAAFAKLGYAVLSDDVVPLLERGNSFSAQSAFPRLCLWPNSVEALFDSADALPRLTPTWEKRYLELNRNGYCFQEEPLPLAAAYILGPRGADQGTPFVEALSGGAGLMSLVANSHVAYLLDKAMRASEFALLARMVKSVPLRHVRVPEDSSSLSRLCEIIYGDLLKLVSPGANPSQA